MAIDHLGISAPPDKFNDIVEWYLKALAPLGYKKVHEFPGQAAGLGDPTPDFWIAAKGGPGATQHFAFTAKDRETVKKFYEAAMSAGGKDNGEPGIRKEYHPTYYGAFVFDPLGNNVEAVCHAEE